MLKIVGVVVLAIVVSIATSVAQDIPASNSSHLPGVADPGKEVSNNEPEGLISAATYSFSTQSGVVLEDMSSGTTQLIGPGVDNANSAVATIGFLFRYDNAFFTSFGVNSNGFVKLGSVVSGTSEANSIASTGNAPKIMPYWDDLCIGNSGKVHYKMIPGPVGTQKLVIEWQNMKITRGNSCDGTGAGTFQLWLYDRTGVIQFVYGSGMGTAATPNGGYSVGIQSGAASNFASVTTAANSVSYSSANNGQIDAIAQGTSYLFSPPVPAAVTGLTASPTQTSVQLNWTDNATNETAYLVRRTTDHINFFFVGNTLAANSTSFTENDLTPGTSYFYYVNALTDGAFGPDVFVAVTTPSGAVISSTAAGGPWSAPSTWVGGVVPDTTDDVTIASGATVVIDTAAAVAGNVYVGSGGASPARLVFGENGAFKLTVSRAVLIRSNDFLTTGAGNANQHILSVGGDLTNNGTLDLSTNNNSAGCTLVFTGDTDNTFGGTGPVTDIRTMRMNKGTSRDNILEMNPANFTVQGTTTDGPASAFLFLDNGTLKISGTFSGNHRVFMGAAYQILGNAGFWLNNPNFTVAGQNGSLGLFGLLRISAGSYNVGTTTGNMINAVSNSATYLEGGTLTITGGFVGSGQFIYNQTAGMFTSCTWGLSSATAFCFGTGSASAQPGVFSLVMSAGDMVIQNPGGMGSAYRNSRGGQFTGNATVHFGNAFTAGAGTFNAAGTLPNVHIDTTGGAHTLFMASVGSNSLNTVNNIDIGTGGALDINSTPFHILGDTFINNGILRGSTSLTSRIFFDAGTQADVTYLGNGTTGNLIGEWHMPNRSFTFGASVGQVAVRSVYAESCNVINSSKLTIGNNSFDGHLVHLFGTSTFDSTPTYALGTGWLMMEYSGTRTTGPEMIPSRSFERLTFTGSGTLTVAGGDITVVNGFLMDAAVVVTGGNTVVSNFFGFSTGYIDGNLKLVPREGGFDYILPLGHDGQYTPVRLNNMTYTAGGSSVSARAIDAVLPGLLPATSASRYWHLETTGDITAQPLFTYSNADVNGNEANYKLWRSSGSPPVMVAGSTVNTATNTVTGLIGTTAFNGDWGIGAQLDPGPVSVSGSVLTSEGAGIRNAIVTISGGNLPSPVVFQTGQFGTYTFGGLQAGETYTLTVGAKRYRFTPASQPVTPVGDLANVNFVANPPE